MELFKKTHSNSDYEFFIVGIQYNVRELHDRLSFDDCIRLIGLIPEYTSLIAALGKVRPTSDAPQDHASAQY